MWRCPCTKIDSAFQSLFNRSSLNESINARGSFSEGHGLLPEMKNWKHDAPHSSASWKTDLGFSIESVAPMWCFKFERGFGLGMGTIGVVFSSIGDVKTLWVLGPNVCNDGCVLGSSFAWIFVFSWAVCPDVCVNVCVFNASFLIFLFFSWAVCPDVCVNLKRA